MAEKLTCRIPPNLSRYRVPASVLAGTARALFETGGGIREAVALWAGRVRDATLAEVTRIVVPHQVTGPLHFNVPLQERLRILRELSPLGEFVLVQLHTHPRQAFHSEADNTMAITKHTGAISIVIPNFGRNWDGGLAATSVHQHLGAARWRKLPPAEVRALFEVV